MHPIPELTQSLKQLRLSGILDSLEARNREAIDGPRPAPRKLAFTDFRGWPTGWPRARAIDRFAVTRFQRIQDTGQAQLFQ